MTPENQGGESPIDRVAQPSRGGNGRATLGIDARQEAQVMGFMDKLTKKVEVLTDKVTKAHTALGKIGSNLNAANPSGGQRPASGGTGAPGSVSASMASSRGSISAPSATPNTGAGTAGTFAAAMPSMAQMAQLLKKIPMPSGGGSGSGSGGGGGGGGGSFFSDAGRMPGITSDARIGIGAEYSLQADRMTAQYQQMYGASNAEIRNGVRKPLASHYMLGGADAINQMMNLQATTGLTATKQASSVEAMRAITGFSLSTEGATKMIAGMSSPDVANRMFMMGGGGMYGIGGKENTAMGNIQGIVRRAGLTNPEALRGALQPGSNTRQRLTAMGVPEDMQDMVIQYAMENTQFQKKTNGKDGMYDPSQESDRKTMGIESNYITQHEKTTGEKIKREERFYGRQTDNFADFEKNLRSATKMLAMFEDGLSGIIGTKISMTGNPAVNFLRDTFGNKAGVGTGLINAVKNIFGGDPTDSAGSSKGSTPTPTGGAGRTATAGGTNRGTLTAEDEAKLATLKPALAVPLRNMMLDNKNIHIGDALRSSEQQERGFRSRYTAHPELTEKTKDEDRIWNGVVWVHDNHAAPKDAPAMAPPGQSMHEVGLAADLSQSQNEWIRANASKYGLDHGGNASRSGRGDEPFHVQPKGTLGQMSGKGSKVTKASRAATKTGGSVSKASKNYVSAKKPSAKYQPASSGAGSVSGGVSKDILSGFSRIEGIDRPITLGGMGQSTSHGGDPIDNMSMSGMQSGGGSYGGGGSIVISPNIYLQGGQDSNGDIRRIAKEVGRLLESEVKLVMMRQS